MKYIIRYPVKLLFLLSMYAVTNIWWVLWVMFHLIWNFKAPEDACSIYDAIANGILINGIAPMIGIKETIEFKTITAEELSKVDKEDIIQLNAPFDYDIYKAKPNCLCPTHCIMYRTPEKWLPLTEWFKQHKETCEHYGK